LLFLPSSLPLSLLLLYVERARLSTCRSVGFGTPLASPRVSVRSRVRRCAEEARLCASAHAHAPTPPARALTIQPYPPTGPVQPHAAAAGDPSGGRHPSALARPCSACRHPCALRRRGRRASARGGRAAGGRARRSRAATGGAAGARSAPMGTTHGRIKQRAAARRGAARALDAARRGASCSARAVSLAVGSAPPCGECLHSVPCAAAQILWESRARPAAPRRLLHAQRYDTRSESVRPLPRAARRARRGARVAAACASGGRAPAACEGDRRPRSAGEV
jgi:hypothetical protein